MSTPKQTNRLADETSPYLLQHQHNPVDWYPWGPEAFETAAREDKLILLSVGYSSCHWCHVMERESFEDAEIAEVMNDLYVSIKVDREERPDIDHVYMQVVQAMTGHGGWPMTVFLTPEGLPIYAGTYFPPIDHRGMPGFVRVLKTVAETWRTRADDLAASGRGLMQRIERAERPEARGDVLLTDEILTKAFATLSRTFDERYGGLDRAPKFPQPMTWEAVLRHYARTGSERARDMVHTTLVRMARGGLYDQLGGGFHRYSVDGQWLVPHFEKMLYDNAQLARLYVDGYRALGDAELARVAEQTLDYLVREMRDPAGGFYSAQDADSEGEEGKFFVWGSDELATVLGDGPTLEAARAYWALDGRPNFEGRFILHVPRDPETVAEQLGIGATELVERLGRAREALFAHREQRVRPGLDDKVLASWNGLACRAFAEAGRVLGRDDFVEVAEQNAAFVLEAMRDDEGRLLRTWKAGEARIPAYLEDYALVIDGLLALYSATFEPRWLKRAIGLADDMLHLFWDGEAGGFYDTGTDHEALVVRPRDTFDSAQPSGSSAAADVLLRVSVLTGDDRYQKRAAETLRSAVDLMDRFPSGAGRFLAALDACLGPAPEVALVWPDDGGPEAFFPVLFGAYYPNLVVAGRPAGAEAPGVPLLARRDLIDGAATAYLCENYTCQQPTTDPSVLAQQLGGEKATK